MKKNALFKEKIVYVYLNENGLVYQMEYLDQQKVRHMPLIENGKNVEKFQILNHEQLSLFWG